MFVLSAIVRNQGKLVVFTNETKYELQRGDYVGQPPIEEAEQVEVSISLDVYNQSEAPKAIGDFKIELASKKVKKLFPAKIYKFPPHYVPYSISVPPLNVMPKNPAHIECKTYLPKEDLDMFGPRIDVFLVAIFPNKRLFRAKIIEMDF